MQLVEPAMAPITITNVLQKLTVVAQMTRFRSKKMCRFFAPFRFNRGNFYFSVGSTRTHVKTGLLDTHSLTRAIILFAISVLNSKLLMDIVEILMVQLS